jgi:hypothetical protein
MRLRAALFERPQFFFNSSTPFHQGGSQEDDGNDDIKFQPQDLVVMGLSYIS